MFPIIFSSIRDEEACWVCFFDIFNAKRQLYNYSEEEVKVFFEEKCKELNLKVPKINFYRHNDQEKLNRDYQSFSPDFIFAQEIKPKSTYWYPPTKAKVIHLAWWDESHHLKDNKHLKPHISILKQKEDKRFYQKYHTRYFGDLRLEHLKYSKASVGNKKRCFIPETYMRINQDYAEINKELISFYNQLFKFLKNKDIEIVWKKREKGFPKGKWASPLDFTDTQPDKVIEKDLIFPSSLVDEAYQADFCFIVDDSFAYFDIINVNSNCYILYVNKKRKYKIDEFFLEYKNKIIEINAKDSWKKIEEVCNLKNNFKKENLVLDNPSNKILKYCREIIKNEKNSSNTDKDK